MSTRMIRVLSFLLLVAACFIPAPAEASHFRGGNVNVQVTEDGVATFTYETLWRKGSAFFPFDGISRISFYGESDTNRSFTRASFFVSIGNTTVFRDVSDPAFDFRRQVIVVDLAAIGLSPGRYVARWQSCCRIAGLQNAPESNFSLETTVVFDGTTSGSPVLNSRILTVVGKGLLYSQNLNAFDPEGGPLSYQFLVGSGRPIEGPSFNIPGITLDETGQVEISPFDTAQLVSVNTRNPAGDYVFKVRVFDADGSFSDRDVLLDVVETDNLPPDIQPVGNRVIDVGESLVLPVTADDPNVVDRVSLSTSVLPQNAVFVSTPGNPATGTLAFRPDASQVGTFGINLEARDDGTPILTDSELVTITVLDPNNTCPVLAPIGNRNLTPGEPFTLVLEGFDADAGQSLDFTASFLPAGATFDPATATFAWTPTEADVGIHLGTVFEVRDSASPPCRDREVVGFSVQPANRFPVLDPIGNWSAEEGAMVTFTVAGSDPDGNALSFAAAPLPLGAEFDPVTRQFMWQPVRGQAGVYEITFSVTDDGEPALTDREVVRIEVDRTGEETIRFVGAEEGQTVAGTLLLEAAVDGDFPVERVDFAIDGQLVNQDTAAPFFLAGDDGGVPLGFDTLALEDGLHVITATALDTAGQTTMAQLKLVFENRIPPVIEQVDGVLDGGVVSGTIVVEAEVTDDRGVASVEFLIDGETVNVETLEPWFLGGSRFARGTFNVSCEVCLQAGDTDGDLVVLEVEHDGTLDALCSGNLRAVSSRIQQRLPLPPLPQDAGNGTPDGETPSEEDVCSELSGRAFGLCNAFCEAQDCDGPGEDHPSCEQLRTNFSRLTGLERFPCEEVGSCIEELVLGLVTDPTKFITVDGEDFQGELTTFELPFALPLGFDTTLLEDGFHTLTVVATDVLGQSTTQEIEIFVQNTLPPDAVQISIVDPIDGATVEEGRVVPLAAEVTNAQGPVTVRFFAGGLLVAEDSEAPFTTSVLVPDGVVSLPLDAVAVEDRGLRQAETVNLSVQPRPVPPQPIEVVDLDFAETRDGLVAVDSSFTLRFSGSVDPGTVASGIRLLGPAGELPVDLTVDVTGTRVLGVPLGSLEADVLHQVIVEGVQSLEGAVAPRFSGRFLTFPDIALVFGTVLDTSFEPLAGIPVRVGEVTTLTGPDGVFRLRDVPTGPQHLEVLGGEVGGRRYPPLEFALEIQAGIEENGIDRPVFLPALDAVGGLEVVGGVASGSGILTSSELPGVQIDLRGVTVSNPDGTPFTGTMTVTPVPSQTVPMDGPPGQFTAATFITVQPGRLVLDPPAPITFPNLDGLPGEQVPLSHFDHDIEDWFFYGAGTVTADGTSIVSNPGVGLPKTGWGCSHPPNTFTDLDGIIVDAEGSPLHGVRVAANRGGVSDLTDDQGRFLLENVPAGREGSPVQVFVFFTARTLTRDTFSGLSASKTAVQNGSTDLGEVEMTNYKPEVGGELVLHGDFSNQEADQHTLEKSSPHASEERYRSEVKALRQRLHDWGFRQGGAEGDRGELLEVLETFDENAMKAVRLFQTLELQNGARGVLRGDGRVGPTERTINAINENVQNELWLEVGDLGFLDYGCPAEPGDGYGTIDAGFLILPFLTGPSFEDIAINDVSLPSGGRFRPHGSHQVGIDIDLPLKRLDSGGCPAHSGWGQTSVFQTAVYDQDWAREILQAAQSFSSLVFFNDSQLCGTEGLCTADAGHNDHIHIRVDPDLMPGGFRADTSNLRMDLDDTGSFLVTPEASSTTALVDLMDRLEADRPLARLFVPGAGPGDVPVDAAVFLLFSEPFDPASLNASTVRLDGPNGPVVGEVTAGPRGDFVQFQPIEELEFVTPYTVSVTTGAVFQDGTLLSEPITLVFTTEGSPSVRVVGAEPEEGSVAVSLNTEISVSFDEPLDPRTVGPDTVFLVEEDRSLRLPAELSLIDGQTTLVIRPTAPLAEIAFFTVNLGQGIRAVDGSHLAGSNFVTSFATSLRPGLERVEVAPEEVVITRADLSPRTLAVTGFFDDGEVRDLASIQEDGTAYLIERHGVVRVEGDGTLQPVGNGETLIDVRPRLEGFEATVRVRVDGVFPEVRFLGRQFALGPDDPIALTFSEPIDAFPLAVTNVEVFEVAGQIVDGTLTRDGSNLIFAPFAPLPEGTDFRIRFDLEITDDLGLTRAFPQTLPFATAAANLGFERGDFTGFVPEGDAEVVSGFGPLTAPEGTFMAKLTNSDLAVDGRISRLTSTSLTVPDGAARLALTYNFFTDEIEQNQPFNDFFRAVVRLPDGTERTIVTVTRDNLRFSGLFSPVPGFDRMTGFRTGSVDVTGMAGETCDLVLEVVVSDAGDSSIDSAVLVDDIRFE